MARNAKLALEYVRRGVWRTVDGRFFVLKEMVPADPMLVTSQWKIAYRYSIRDFRDYDGPTEYPELAPEVGVVGAYREVYPWLGRFTGEGSFEVGNPGREEAKVPGGKSLRERRHDAEASMGWLAEMMRG